MGVVQGFGYYLCVWTQVENSLERYSQGRLLVDVLGELGIMSVNGSLYFQGVVDRRECLCAAVVRQGQVQHR